MSTLVMELYDALRKAGADDEAARAAARAVIAVEDRAHLATRADLAELRLATRADLDALRLATRADLAGLRLEMRAELADVRAEIAALRAEMAEHRLATRADLAELKADLIKWNVGAMAVLTAIFAGISRLV